MSEAEQHGSLHPYEDEIPPQSVYMPSRHWIFGYRPPQRSELAPWSDPVYHIGRQAGFQFGATSESSGAPITASMP